MSGSSTTKWRPLSSVRARVTALAVLLVAAALTLASTALVLTLDRSLTRGGDDLSRSRAADLAVLASNGTLPQQLENAGDDSVAQVVTDDGEVLAASDNITGKPSISSFTPSGREPAVRTMRRVPDDNESEDFRVWALRAETENGLVTVYVGTSLESVGQAVSTLTRNLLVGIPILVALLGITIWFLLGRTLRPVETIRSAVAAISHQGLDRRVPVPPHRDEIARLAATMNEMLDRLEVASRRQREFVANASHELQSPLAAFRAQLEVAQAHPAGTDWSQTAADLRDDSDRMERLVRDLLFLAREDEHAPPDDLVDLDVVVLEESTRLRTSFVGNLDTAKVTGAPVRGSRDDLARLTRNLLENARNHATSEITVELSATGSLATLTVADDGPGVPVDHRERIFDRFYRADESRTPASGGTGLGLAIARAIAERHGGSLDLQDSAVGARFVVRLPDA